MNKQKLLLPAFILVALAQLYVPASMIWSRENVLKKGTEYKFKTELVDPNDPFRGKYITLSFEDNIMEVENTADWNMGEDIYASITTDEEGFAQISAISREEPDSGEEFISAKVGFIAGLNTDKLRIEFPFDRYYMEESKAYEAEVKFREAQRDTSQLTYALVNIRNGQSVLKDVMIEGISIKELVESEEE